MFSLVSCGNPFTGSAGVPPATLSQARPRIIRATRSTAGGTPAVPVILILLTLILCTPTSAQNRSSQRIVIAADTILDGRGQVLRNTRIVIRKGKIVAINPIASPVNYNLRGLTVLPGWIDSHVHISWAFDENGKNAGGGSNTLFAKKQSAENARATLMAGFTTVQSVGSPHDVALRNAIAAGHITGPRILTSAEPLAGRGPQTGTPDEIRAFIRRQKSAGADVIKIFAANSIRRPELTLSPEQLLAACDEANKVGLRTVVHAYNDAVRAASLAGCTQVEHGTLATDDDLRLLGQRATYLDPQAGLVWQNYLDNKERFVGTLGYPATVEGFTPMEKLIPEYREFLKRASKIAGLKIVFGSDALAGSHGRNAEEFVMRVRDVGLDPMSVMVSANSLAAEALRLGNQIGTIAPGMQADIIALDGDPLKDITAVRRVVFVMKGGIVYKNWERGRPASR